MCSICWIERSKMKAILNHVAIFVNNIEKIVGRNLFPSDFIGEIEILSCH